MKLYKISFIVIVLSILSGCAIGNKYDYQEADISLPVKGTSTVSLGVVDKRDYVLNGNKPANFTGLQRGGFGNPFDVTTRSGKPLTDDITEALSRALQNAGFQVNNLYFSSPDTSLVASVIKKGGTEKSILLTVSEWKTDVYMNISVSYDFLLQILNQQGKEIASASMNSNGIEKLSGAGFEGQNSRAATAALETKIARLFNDPAIIQALKD